MDTHDYTATLRLPKTDFAMRALASGNGGGRALDVESLERATGSRDEADSAYRSLRGCFRWMLGCLAHADGRLPKPDGVPPLERHAAQVLAERSEAHGRLLAGAQTGAVVRNLRCLARDDLMGFYFDVRKDVLYCDGKDSPRRLAALAFCEHAFRALARMAGAVAPNLAGEALGHFRPLAGSMDFPPPLPGWPEVRTVRKAVLGLLDGERARRAFNSSLDLRLVLHVADPHLADALDGSGWNPAETLCVSQAETRADDPPQGCLRPAAARGFTMSLSLAEGRRCARSYRVTGDVGADPAFPLLSARDAKAVREAGVQAEG